MATKVRASCPECGDVTVPIELVTVVDIRSVDDLAYRFRCCCGSIVFRETEARIFDLLVESGAATVIVDVPAEPGERPVGLPITHDDILDFHDQLGDSWVDQLLDWTPEQR